MNWDFDERELPPMSVEMFSTLVISRLRPVEGIEVQGSKGAQLVLRVRGREVTAYLERHYERYRANPDALTPVIDQLIQTLATGASDDAAGTAEFAALAPNLFPRLLTAQQWMDKRGAGLRLVIRSLVQDLGIALVLDRAVELEYVQLDAIPAWGIEAQQAYDAAMLNLERVSAGVETIVSGEGVETLLIDSQRDGHAAARALLPARRQDWQARVEGELVLGMPTRDLLLGFSRQHPAFDELRAQIVQDATARPDGLFPHLLSVHNELLEILEPG